MTTSTEMETNSAAKEVTPFRLDLPVPVLAKIDSFGAAFALAQEIAETVGQKVVFSDELGDGFVGLDRNGKRELLGKRFVMISANFGHDEATQSDFVVCRVVTVDDKKYRFADGSTGVYAQIRAMVDDKGGFVPIVANKGLRVSEYTTQDAEGKTIKASTFYIDESVDD